MGLLAQHTDDPVQVPVAIETDKNLIVVALQAAGLSVFAITKDWVYDEVEAGRLPYLRLGRKHLRFHQSQL